MCRSVYVLIKLELRLISRSITDSSWFIPNCRDGSRRKNNFYEFARQKFWKGLKAELRLSIREPVCCMPLAGWNTRVETGERLCVQRMIAIHLNWHFSSVYFNDSLACRCAEVARRQNFTVFGLQNYAECWSGPNAEKSFNRNGGSDRCLMILKLPPDCNMADPTECMGMDNVNFIYKLGKFVSAHTWIW